MVKRREVGSQGPRATSAAVGNVFRSAREQQHLSQNEVAAMTQAFPSSLSRTMISFIENGRSLPGLESLVTLSTVLHVDPGEIIELVQMNVVPRTDCGDLTDDELREQARQLFWDGDYRASLATLDVMLGRLVADRDMEAGARQSAQARIEVNRSTVLRRCGALKSAQASAERAIAWAEGSRELQAEGYICLSAILVDKGCLPVARDSAARAVTLARDATPAVKGQAFNQRGDALYASGQYAKALEAFESARTQALEASDHHHRIKTEGNIGSCLLLLGQRKRAATQFRRAVQLARKHADPQAESLWTVELGWQAYESGELDEADRLAVVALRIAKRLDLVLTIFRAEWLRHVVAIRRKPQAADRHRLAYLRRLLTRLHQHGGVNEVMEFRELIAQEH